MNNKGTQIPVDLSFARSASESPPSPLAAPGRRRTQEQGQGDLDDDRQDAPPVETSQGQAVDPNLSSLASASDRRTSVVDLDSPAKSRNDRNPCLERGAIGLY